jgi:hypothetical protein
MQTRTLFSTRRLAADAKGTDGAGAAEDAEDAAEDGEAEEAVDYPALLKGKEEELAEWKVRKPNPKPDLKLETLPMYLVRFLLRF